MRKKRIKKEKGFTLIELLVTSVLLLLIAIPLVYMFMGITKSTVQSRLITLATARAQEKIEEIKNTASTAAGYAGLTPGGDPPPFYLDPPANTRTARRDWAVIVSAYQKRVIVTVSDDRNLPAFEPVILDTIIAQPL